MSDWNIEFDEDFAGYFDSDFGHAITATYTPFGGTSKTIKVIRDEEYNDIIDGEVSIESYTPVAYVYFDDVQNVATGDDLVVNAYKDLDGNVLKAQTSYKIVNIENDRTGIIKLILEEQ
jgi:hypothetical protein